MAIVHLYPHTSLLPVSCLAQFTDKSLITFCKQHLYGSHAFAGRKVAYYPRYSIGTPYSSFIIMSTEEKPVLHTREKEGLDDSFCVRGFETLTNSVYRRRVFQQAMQGTYLFKFVLLRQELCLSHASDQHPTLRQRKPRETPPE